MACGYHGAPAPTVTLTHPGGRSEPLDWGGEWDDGDCYAYRVEPEIGDELGVCRLTLDHPGGPLSHDYEGAAGREGQQLMAGTQLTLIRPAVREDFPAEYRPELTEHAVDDWWQVRTGDNKQGWMLADDIFNLQVLPWAATPGAEPCPIPVARE